MAVRNEPPSSAGSVSGSTAFRLCLAFAALGSLCIQPGCARHASMLEPGINDPAMLERITVPPETAQKLDTLLPAVPPTGAPAKDAPVIPTETTEEDLEAPTFSLGDAITFALQNNPRLGAAPSR